jgi:hypothetical protein
MNIAANLQPDRLLLPIVLLAAVATGCESGERIETYTVAKEKAAAPPAVDASVPADAKEPTHRMVAAVLPAGDRAWFFKVVGPLDAVDARGAEVEQFLASIRLGEDGRPTWKLPAEDWTQEQGGGMRAATIWIPAGEERLELSVIPLPWPGQPGDILNNVNRWRAQMQLPPASQQQLAEITRDIKIGDRTLTVADLRGRFQGGPSMAPFARGAQDQSGQPPQLPPGHPPIHGANDGDR